jgi:hypothetical protein
VSRLDPLEGCRGAFGDRVHAAERARTAGLGMPAREASSTSEVEDPPGQLPGQAAEVGTVDGLVDRLGAQPACRLVGELAMQAARDLLRAPARRELVRDPVAQRLVAGQAAGPMEAAAPERPPVGLERPVPAGRIDAAAEFPADRRERPAHDRRDLAHRAPLAAQVGEADALVLG